MEHDENHMGAPAMGEVQRLRIEFTGSGSEYFRIWLVNMLLILITLGFYWPWAKVRRLRYFWGNTLVDGDPLGFHGEAKQMFKGWVLVGVLFGLYNWASNFSAVAGLLAFAVLAVLWPALWRSSMVFRMGNTSWRGLRFRFVGSMRGAYQAHLPPFLVSLPMLLLAMWIPRENQQEPPDWAMWSIGGWFALLLLCLPWLLWRIKAYQHRHYALGPLQTDFRASLKSFYLLALKPLLLLVGITVVVLTSQGSEGQLGERLKQMLWVVPFLLLGFWLVMFLGIGPWITTRLQNLVWTKTGNSQMRFISGLSFRSMFWLSVKNGLLIAVTFGLYWPFAQVAMARLRLEAVHIRSITDMQALLAVEHDRPEEAAGEAAGDFFGLDVGL